MNAIAESLGIKEVKAEIPAETGIEAAPAQPEPKSMVLPEGEYPLQDGRVIVIDEMGMIVEVRGSIQQMPEPEEAPVEPAPAEEPMEKKDEDMSAKLSALQAELDALKASATQAKAEAEAATEIATKAVQALGDFKKKTVGDDSAPMAGAKFDRTPVSAVTTDHDLEMKKEIFAKLGLSHLIK
jgi:hypothetical protein